MVSESRKRAGGRERARATAGIIGAPTAEPTAKPCGACGTTGGVIHPRGRAPMRIDGARFGFATLICKKCHGRHRDRELRAASHPRCGRCGTDGGYVRPNGILPMRYDAERFGHPGSSWCHACVAAEPGAAQSLYGAHRVREAASPSPDEVARAAAAILDAIAEVGRKAEARRVAEAYAASRWVSPAAGARLARKEYRATSFGAMALRPQSSRSAP